MRWAVPRSSNLTKQSTLHTKTLQDLVLEKPPEIQIKSQGISQSNTWGTSPFPQRVEVPMNVKRYQKTLAIFIITIVLPQRRNFTEQNLSSFSLNLMRERIINIFKFSPTVFGNYTHESLAGKLAVDALRWLLVWFQRDWKYQLWVSNIWRGVLGHQLTKQSTSHT